jgi:hypothetical protein
MWCYNYINSNNIYLELINSSSTSMTFYQSKINYDVLNSSNTDFTLIKSSTISSSLYVKDVFFSASVNFGLFITYQPPYRVYSFAAICTSISNC